MRVARPAVAEFLSKTQMSKSAQLLKAEEASQFSVFFNRLLFSKRLNKWNFEFKQNLKDTQQVSKKSEKKKDKQIRHSV